jgi:hypothetical protein
MRQYKIIKNVDHAQIGHLYEHIFCNALEEFCKNKGLYAYLDYNVTARAFFFGLVEISFDMYSPRAEAEKDNIVSFEPTFTKDAINCALIQIMAEKHADIKAIDVDIVMEKLAQYQATPWRSFSALGVQDAARHKRSRAGLELKRRSSRQFMTLRADVMIDMAFANKDKKRYWPLFYVVASMLIANLEDNIPVKLRCYSSTNFRKYSSKSLKETALFTVDRRQATGLTTEITVTQELVSGMLEQGCIERLADWLQQVTYEIPYASPNWQVLYDASALIVSDAGWHEIGTQQNIEDVLRRMTIHFSLGTTRDYLAIASLFENSKGRS